MAPVPLKSGGSRDVVHFTVRVEPIEKVAPALGDVISTMDWGEEIRGLILGDALVDAARTRAVRRAVKSCIANVVEYVELEARGMSVWNVV
jgi:hypothetical protein